MGKPKNLFSLHPVAVILQSGLQLGTSQTIKLHTLEGRASLGSRGDAPAVIAMWTVSNVSVFSNYFVAKGWMDVAHCTYVNWSLFSSLHGYTDLYKQEQPTICLSIRALNYIYLHQLLTGKATTCISHRLLLIWQK